MIKFRLHRRKITPMIRSIRMRGPPRRLHPLLLTTAEVRYPILMPTNRRPPSKKSRGINPPDRLDLLQIVCVFWLLARRADEGILLVFRGGATKPGDKRRSEVEQIQPIRGIQCP